MKHFELIETRHAEVVCDGGAGAVGHPRIYLHIDASVGQITCPYCSKTYLLKKVASKAS